MTATAASWDPSLALERRRNPVRIYFRDDDAGWDDAALMRLLDSFARHGIPIDLAVIPCALTNVLARSLRAAATRQPLGLHQHGYRHLNHESTGRKCEFGPSRDARAQALDIAAGAALLRDGLGALVQPLFTPPWNRCTQETVVALACMEFHAISRDAAADPLDSSDLDTLPVHLDWQKRDQRSVDWSKYLATTDAVGIMLHHAAMSDRDHADLDELITALRAHTCVRFTAMNDLLGKR